MKPHQKRVVTELDELNIKRDKLAVFLCGDNFRSLDSAEQLRLNRQAQAMEKYAEILRERIANFT